jgi:signal transduction histidine kinase
MRYANKILLSNSSEQVAQAKAIRFEFQLSNTPLSIQADLGQMEQVLINILKNAIEAIHTEGGLIVLKTDAAQKYLQIEDNGKGIATEDLEKIFTPFHSTKVGGQGIGLTLTREVLSNHGFSFSLKSKETTTFEIRFS